MDNSYMDFLDMIEEGLIKIKALANVLLGAHQDLLDETTLPCLAGMIESEADLPDHLIHVLFRALMGQPDELRAERTYSNMQVLTGWEYLQVSGSKQRGSRNVYRLVADEPIHLIDLSMIPTPQEMEASDG